MDELKIKTNYMRGLVGKAVTRYLRNRGIDLELVINDIDGETGEEGTMKIHADVEVLMTKGQVVKLLG